MKAASSVTQPHF